MPTKGLRKDTPTDTLKVLLGVVPCLLGLPTAFLAAPDPAQGMDLPDPDLRAAAVVVDLGPLTVRHRTVCVPACDPVLALACLRAPTSALPLLA